MSLSRLGTIVLAIWLILTGVAGFINIGELEQILGILAVAAGILILISR
jgi:hypothetical protein